MANNQGVVLAHSPASHMRSLMLLIGIAVAVAAGVAVVLWWRGPSWSLLYGNLSGADASQVVQSLQTAGIEYKLNDSSGAIMVPAEKVHEARLQLASQGLPEGGNSGIDMLSKDSGIGVSQFMETARYQNALEGELARTISSLRSVAAARVHLAMSQQSAFVRDRRPATASVLVQLKPGTRLEAEQVQAIVHLVASSIPELNAKEVTVVDQQGRLLTSPDSAGSTTSTEHFDAANRVEENYAQRIEQLLVPLVGAGRVRAQVTVDLDPGSTEETREQYKPDGSVVRSEQTSEEISNSRSAQTGGVPGSLSNQPPTGGTAVAATAATGSPTTAAAANAATSASVSSGPENSSKSATRNFEIDRTLSYTKQPGGRIKRVTAAVLLDNVHKTGADGKESTEPLSAAQIEDITRLVKNAVGFDEARGDSVNVVNAAFREDVQNLTPESVPIWKQPWILDIGRLALGALVLLALALGVIKPLVRNLAAGHSSGAAAAAGAGGAMTEVAGTNAPAPLALEQQVVQAKSLVSQDPKRVAQVVKTWVGDR